MNERFTLVYKKENMSDIEVQLLNKLYETDLTNYKIAKENEDKLPEMVIDEILQVYKDNEKNSLYMFAKYSLGEYLGACTMYVPNLSCLENLCKKYDNHDKSSNFTDGFIN